MKIAICDDCELQVEYFKHRIEPFLKQNGDRNYTIDGYFSGEPLIDDVKDGKWFDMIVLDVVLKNENGVDIAKELRECGYKGKILSGQLTRILFLMRWMLNLRIISSREMNTEECFL